MDACVAAWRVRSCARIDGGVPALRASRPRRARVRSTQTPRYALATRRRTRPPTPGAFEARLWCAARSPLQQNEETRHDPHDVPRRSRRVRRDARRDRTPRTAVPPACGGVGDRAHAHVQLPLRRVQPEEPADGRALVRRSGRRASLAQDDHGRRDRGDVASAEGRQPLGRGRRASPLCPPQLSRRARVLPVGCRRPARAVLARHAAALHLPRTPAGRAAPRRRGLRARAGVSARGGISRPHAERAGLRDRRRALRGAAPEPDRDGASCRRAGAVHRPPRGSGRRGRGGPARCLQHRPARRSAPRDRRHRRTGRRRARGPRGLALPALRRDPPRVPRAPRPEPGVRTRVAGRRKPGDAPPARGRRQGVRRVPGSRARARLRERDLLRAAAGPRAGVRPAGHGVRRRTETLPRHRHRAHALPLARGPFR